MSDKGAGDTPAVTPSSTGHAGPPGFQSPKPGDVLNGKYRVERVVGRGGMGIVMVAQHLELDERVALKLMLPEALESTEAAARFLAEARAAVKIKGEHVARVLDIGKLEGGEPYIVMEYLEGVDLAELLDKNGPCAIEDAVEFILQACEALAEAHAIGIIHRDLKPSNLFLARRPDGSALIKVLDFGISKIVPRDSGRGPVDFSMTTTRQGLGSPFYMPPEQIESARKADMTSDIWSLGAILYELLTGMVPFDGNTLPEIRRRIRAEPAPDLRVYRRNAPRGLEEVIKRCLEKDPEKRYPNVAELSVALSEFAPEQARVYVKRICRIIENAGLTPAAPLSAPLSTPALPPRFERTQDAPRQVFTETLPAPSTRRPRRLFAVVAVLLSAVIIGGAVFLVRRPTEELRHLASPQLPVAGVPDAPKIAAPEPPVPPAPLASLASPSPASTDAVPGTPQDASTRSASAQATASGKPRPKAPASSASRRPSPAASVLPSPDPLDAEIH